MKEEYQTYLQSQEWQHVRQDAFKEQGDGCLACGSFLGVQLHHIYYPQDIWATDSEHVIPLCRKCHETAHCMAEKPYTWDYSKLEATKQRVLLNLKRQGRALTYHDHPSDNARIKMLKLRKQEHAQIVARARREELYRHDAANKARREEHKRLQKIANEARKAAPKPPPPPPVPRAPKIKKKAKLRAIEEVLKQMRDNPGATHYVFDLRPSLLTPT